jgi:ubiquinone/menaquinone biosynthesis C-methylase UbiE/uncharacterized protein YbaR (Trm112 family)
MATSFDSLQPLLACPACNSDLHRQNLTVSCSGCGVSFVIEMGIPRLIQDTDIGDGGRTAKSADYQSRFQQLGVAQQYNESFIKRGRKEQRTRREIDILQGLLGRVGRVDTAINIPSGGGRLSGPLDAATTTLIEMDSSLDQLSYGKQHSTLSGGYWIQASALHIPLKNDSVDVAVCARLSHHLPGESERRRLLSELLRVSRRFVVISFVDKHSLKNASRYLRRRPLDQSAMAASELGRLAASMGAKLDSVHTVSAIGSRHRYALLQKT